MGGALINPSMLSRDSSARTHLNGLMTHLSHKIIEIIKMIETLCTCGHKSLLFLGGVCLLSLGCGATPVKTTPAQPQAQSKSSKGNPARVITFNASEGRSISLSDYQGAPVFMYVFTTWCQACVQDLPRLNQMSAQLKSYGVEVIAVCAEGRGCPRLKEVTRQREFSFKMWVGDLLLARGEGPYGPVLGVPVSYLIDSKGYLIDRFRGRPPLHYVMEILSNLQSSSSTPSTTTPQERP